MSTKASPEALRLADEMVAMEDVMREILNETIPEPGSEAVEVMESGRTVCGPSSNIHGPHARFPSAVQLASCPRGVNGGTWHTHVTKTQLREPTNSLPDTANVIFGDIDVSAVVGTRSVEMVVAPDDRQAGADMFRNVLGADVSSTDDVVDAIIGGRVGDPEKARDRVRSEMPGIFRRHQVNFAEIDKRLEMSGVPASSPISMEMHEAQHYAVFRNHGEDYNWKNPARDPRRFKQYLREHKNNIKDTTGVAAVAKETAVGEIVRRAFRSVL